MGVNGQLHATAALSPGKKLSVLWIWGFGRHRGTLLSLAGFKPQIVQPITHSAYRPAILRACTMHLSTLFFSSQRKVLCGYTWNLKKYLSVPRNRQLLPSVAAIGWIPTVAVTWNDVATCVVVIRWPYGRNVWRHNTASERTPQASGSARRQSGVAVGSSTVAAERSRSHSYPRHRRGWASVSWCATGVRAACRASVSAAMRRVSPRIRGVCTLLQRMWFASVFYPVRRCFTSRVWVSEVEKLGCAIKRLMVRRTVKSRHTGEVSIAESRQEASAAVPPESLRSRACVWGMGEWYYSVPFVVSLKPENLPPRKLAS
jgi:hypothetical protein